MGTQGNKPDPRTVARVEPPALPARDLNLVDERVELALTAGEAEALDRLVASGLFGFTREDAAHRLLDRGLIEELARLNRAGPE